MGAAALLNIRFHFLREGNNGLGMAQSVVINSLKQSKCHDIQRHHDVCRFRVNILQMVSIMELNNRQHKATMNGTTTGSLDTYVSGLRPHKADGKSTA